MSSIPIFDGHNDVLARLYLAGGVSAAPQFASGRPNGHVDKEKAVEGGFAGGFFAIWVPNEPDKKLGSERAPTGKTGPRVGQRARREVKTLTDATAMGKPRYDIPLPPEISLEAAQRVARIQLATLQAMEAEGAVTITRSAGDIEAAMAKGQIAALMHMEGAEAIDPEFAMLDTLYEAGLRSLGPVWSRPTRYGHGVPFRFPGSPDIGDGLLEDGKRLVQACNQRKIMVDLAHLNEKGFWDVEALSDAPLVATHSNAHALCPHTRNLTDKQLDAVAATGGVVGINFAAAFLRTDGRMVADTPLSLIGDHVVYMIERMGEDHVAFGSDFDGAVVPAALESSAGLQLLMEDLRNRGLSAENLTKIAHGNWLRVLRETLGS